MKSLLSTPQAAAHCGLSPRTLEKMRITGQGAPYHKLGRAVRYDIADLDAWIASNRRASTADPGRQTDENRRGGSETPGRL